MIQTSTLKSHSLSEKTTIETFLFLYYLLCVQLCVTGTCTKNCLNISLFLIYLYSSVGTHYFNFISAILLEGVPPMTKVLELDYLKAPFQSIL